jgi:hypothetical protein
MNLAEGHVREEEGVSQTEKGKEEQNEESQRHQEGKGWSLSQEGKLECSHPTTNLEPQCTIASFSC